MSDDLPLATAQQVARRVVISCEIYECAWWHVVKVANGERIEDPFMAEAIRAELAALRGES